MKRDPSNDTSLASLRNRVCGPLGGKGREGEWTKSWLVTNGVPYNGRIPLEKKT